MSDWIDDAVRQVCDLDQAVASTHDFAQRASHELDQLGSQAGELLRQAQAEANANDGHVALAAQRRADQKLEHVQRLAGQLSAVGHRLGNYEASLPVGSVAMALVDTARHGDLDLRPAFCDVPDRARLAAIGSPDIVACHPNEARVQPPAKIVIPTSVATVRGDTLGDTLRWLAQLRASSPESGKVKADAARASHQAQGERT